MMNPAPKFTRIAATTTPHTVMPMKAKAAMARPAAATMSAPHSIRRIGPRRAVSRAEMKALTPNRAIGAPTR